MFRVKLTNDKIAKIDISRVTWLLKAAMYLQDWQFLKSVAYYHIRVYV